MKKALTISLLTILSSTFLLHAQRVISLYDGKAPGSESWTWIEKENNQNMFNTRVVYNVSDPTLTVYLPDPAMATGTAVVIAPGGGFHMLSIDSEGIEVAKWLNAKGVAAFVLKYRLIKSETEDPVKEMMSGTPDKKKSEENNALVIPMAIADGKKAMEYVRAHTKEFDILPNQIGLMGFSAGGTVTMGVAYNYSAESRPDFVIPVYPYLTDEQNKLSVPSDAPPLFVVVASDDQLGLAPASIKIYSDWINAKKTAELHAYAKGGHGFGMRKLKLPTDNWIERLGEWMKAQGYLKKLRPTKMEQQYSEEQIAEMQKSRDDKAKNDWANLSKYQEENKKAGLPKAGENRVVFLGNSITENWVNINPDFFSKNSFIGRGISGQTSPQALLRFRQDVIDLKPKAVIISIGTNDIAENTGPYNPEITLGNVASMVELAKENNIKVVLASVHPAFEFGWRKSIMNVPDKILQYNAMLKAYATKNKLVYLDYHTAMKDNRNGMSREIAEDGVHPTLAGYRIMESLAEKAIKEALK